MRLILGKDNKNSEGDFFLGWEASILSWGNKNCYFLIVTHNPPPDFFGYFFLGVTFKLASSESLN